MYIIIISVGPYCQWKVKRIIKLLWFVTKEINSIFIKMVIFRIFNYFTNFFIEWNQLFTMSNGQWLISNILKTIFLNIAIN